MMESLGFVIVLLPYILCVVMFIGFICIWFNTSCLRKEVERQTDLLEELLADSQRHTNSTVELLSQPRQDKPA